ncbi:YchJ family protein [Aeromicrobium sp. CF4.19]|uniref:YchJ family protein n=1 Tax=Aeromicrobium sp. CF4.19 TaxID=3373082 RepID=UPI003EE513E2
MSDCPCGNSLPFQECCRPLHRQERLATTAEELMRSRYSAYAVRDDDHVFRTWHPRTRPEDVSTSQALRWQGLEVLATDAGRESDDRGTVEFRARYATDSQRGVMHELSRFERRAGRWFYVDGDEVGRSTPSPGAPTAR